MAKTKKFYVVWRGRATGVFDRWDDAKAQVEGVEGAQYKGFTSRDEAEAALREGYKPSAIKPKTTPQTLPSERPLLRSIAVDAACSGNPGVMEYRGVALWNNKEIFHLKFDLGTNNIGEFLAIVHGLALLKQKNCTDVTLYTDSRIAMNWVRSGQCRTKLDYTPRTAELFDLIHRAEEWLSQNKIETPIVKWPTEAWGEIPADFGRK